MPKVQRKEIYIDFDKFKLGLFALDDTTKAPFGTAREMKNMQVTDRGGIAPREGTKILGTENTNRSPVQGLYNFRKSFETDEILIKAYDTELEGYSRDNTNLDWWTIEDLYTSDKEFGFATSLVNEQNQDYVVFGNRFDDFRRWNGVFTTLSADVADAATEIPVTTVFTEEVFESKTGADVVSNTSTTLQADSPGWATSQWVDLYVYIKDGSEVNQIRKITSNTADTITFEALDGAPGAVDFEIRKLLFPATGTVLYNGSRVEYTAITEFAKLTVTSAHAGTSGDVLVSLPELFPDNPRGNRFTNYLGRIIVGRVRSALARDSGGALHGYAAGGSYFVSQGNDPVDFTFAAARAAGEGDIIGTPYGGGEIEDVTHQEDKIYVFKPRYIEASEYSKDSQDIIIREPLKAETGSIGPVIKGTDDVYFITPDNKFTSLGRVSTKDVKPQIENIGAPIKRLLDVYKFGKGRGIEYKDKIYIPTRSSASVATNDILIVYNKIIEAYEGVWDIGANFFQEWNEGLYFGDSTSSNVRQMFVGNSDVDGGQKFPIVARYATHFINLTPSTTNLQALNTVSFEGYISSATTINFKVWRDFSNDAFLEFAFNGNEEQFQEGGGISAFLGGKPLATNPLGSFGDVDSDGRKHFFFKIYFPFQYGNYFSFGFESDQIDDNYEIIRAGLGLKETISTRTSQIKNN